MSNKDNDTDNVVELLKQPHFGKQDAGIPASVDPVMETTLVLTLDQLVEYDRNPRNAPNAEYETLRASYLKTGASNTLLVVTKRPGEERYFPAAGGNTRLRILKELWEETGDEKYYRIDCKFIPFRDDRKILIDHLVENDNRADYIFIDRAKGIFQIYDDLNDEHMKAHKKPLSQRAFIDLLVNEGYPKISQTQLIRFQYAVRLYEHIPLALDGGMHDNATRLLQKTQDSLKEFMDLASGGIPELAAEFDRFWNLILEDLDNPDGIDLDVVAHRIFEALAPTVARRVPELDDGQIIARLKHLWDQWREDRTLSVSLRQGSASRRADPHSTRAGSLHRYTEDERETFARDLGDSGGLPAGGESGSDTRHPDRQADQSGDGPLPPGGASGPPDHGGHAPDLSEHNLSGRQEQDPPPGGVEHTRAVERKIELYNGINEETFRYAQPLAESCGIGDLIVPIGKVGFGYVIDLPDPKRPMDSFARICWWLLWDFSGITTDPGSIPQHLEQELKGTRIAHNYAVIAGGRASATRQELDALPPDRRQAKILEIFRNVVNSTVPRSHDHCRFLLMMPPSQYRELTAFIEFRRKAHELYESIVEELERTS